MSCLKSGDGIFQDGRQGGRVLTRVIGRRGREAQWTLRQRARSRARSLVTRGPLRCSRQRRRRAPPSPPPAWPPPPARRLSPCLRRVAPGPPSSPRPPRSRCSPPSLPPASPILCRSSPRWPPPAAISWAKGRSLSLWSSVSVANNAGGAGPARPGPRPPRRPRPRPRRPERVVRPRARRCGWPAPRRGLGGVFQTFLLRPADVPVPKYLL